MIDQQAFNSLVNGFLHLTQVVNGEPVDQGSEWKNDAQMLAIKCAKSAVSLNYLSGCLHVFEDDKGKGEFIDHSSVAILGRSVFEASLALRYTFCHQVSEVREYRYLLWMYGGLFDRSKIFPSTEYGISHAEKNQSALEEVKAIVLDNPIFQRLDKNKKKNVISSGNWRPEHAWIDIAVEAGYDRKYFANIYNHLCGHAHASYISVLQTRDSAYSVEDQKKLSSTVVDMCAVVISNLALDYVNIFPRAGDVLMRDSDFHQALLFWSALAKPG